MPVIIHETFPGGEIVVWETTEDYDALTSHVMEEDIVSASRFKNPNRRVEHLASRAALRTVTDGEIRYDKNGVPHTDYSNISLSHCKGAAAVIFSGFICAVDIEGLKRNFSRASSKFVSPEESQLPFAGHPLFLPAMWCAKETLYKYALVPGLDFTRDLQVLSGDLAGLGNGGSGHLTARVMDGRNRELLTGIGLVIRRTGEFIFCHTSLE